MKKTTGLKESFPFQNLLLILEIGLSSGQLDHFYYYYIKLQNTSHLTQTILNNNETFCVFLILQRDPKSATIDVGYSVVAPL